MEKSMEVGCGDIVQIDPFKDPVFGGCFVFVQETRDWGIIGYIQIPGMADKGSLAYVRRRWEQIEWCGQATWREEKKEEQDE